MRIRTKIDDTFRMTLDPSGPNVFKVVLNVPNVGDLVPTLSIEFKGVGAELDSSVRVHVDVDSDGRIRGRSFITETVHSPYYVLRQLSHKFTDAVERSIAGVSVITIPVAFEDIQRVSEWLSWAH